MAWIYLLQSIHKKWNQNLPPLFPIFYDHSTDNSHDSQCAMSEEEDGGYSVQLLI
jgi:hypothetical protein